VQTNSATAEESAAASEELSSQATLLKDMVSKFQLKQQYSQENQPLALALPAQAKPRALPGNRPVIRLQNEGFGKY
jgi:methyl-accepting chemotaxis protein